MRSHFGINNSKIKTLDCTIRDGGLVNEHRFDLDFVRAVYRACAAANVDYMELGYKNSDKIFSPSENGAWKFCKEKDLFAVLENEPKTTMKLACMIDAGKSDWKADVLPKEQSPLSMIRVAFYHYQIDEAVEMIEDASAKGYEVSANLMAVTAVDEIEVDRVLEKLVQTPASTIVVVDSFGSLTPFQAEYLTNKYLEYAAPVGKEVGMHAHNNLQLAFANTLMAAKCGATRIDASLGGLGRGAGNCLMELLLGVVNPERYNLRPLIECLEKEILSIRKQIEWGPYPEFMLTAQSNVHPRAAIAARKSPETRDKYTALLDQLEKSVNEK